MGADQAGDRGVTGVVLRQAKLGLRRDNPTAMC
jgi:hypothetical protein